MRAERAQLLSVGAASVILATGLWFVSSRLIFAPVPWPDGSAFYLPSIDLFAWPPRWLMHNQAAFVPSYDVANFNIMPAFSAYLGLGTALGLRALLGSVLAIKVLSLVPVLVLAWVLWRWLSRERLGTRTVAVATSVALAALWDPTLRWGALAVRSEPVIGVFWALLVWELAARKPRLWRIGLWLAAAAWVHYEAVYLVPAVAVALGGTLPAGLDSGKLGSFARAWWGRLFGVGWRTALFLSPWILFALFHFEFFTSQMDIAFHRLSHGNRYTANPYLIFHSLFFWLGSPVGTPKFFNLAKAVFWALSLALTLRALVLARKPDGLVRLGVGLAFWMSLYLWFSKPEVWYTTLCHVTLWPWIALELVLQSRGRESRGRESRGRESGAPESKVPMAKAPKVEAPMAKAPKVEAPMAKAPKVEARWRTLPWACATYAVLSLLATFGQQLRIPPYYDWTHYHAWVSCIEKQTELAAEAGGHRVRIWQPGFPDALVELSDRHRDYDLTRALDFEARRPLAQEFGRSAEVLLFTRSFNLSPSDERVSWGEHPTVPSYQGPERPQDAKLLAQNDVESPFGPWAAGELEASEPGARTRSVCQEGPFWAEIFRKVAK